MVIAEGEGRKAQGQVKPLNTSSTRRSWRAAGSETRRGGVPSRDFAPPKIGRQKPCKESIEYKANVLYVSISLLHLC